MFRLQRSGPAFTDESYHVKTGNLNILRQEISSIWDQSWSGVHHFLPHYPPEVKNSSPRKRYLPIVFQPSFFRGYGYVKLQEGSEFFCRITCHPRIGCMNSDPPKKNGWLVGSPENFEELVPPVNLTASLYTPEKWWDWKAILSFWGR